MQHLSASVFSPEKRDTVIVGGASLLSSEASDARLSVDSTGVSAEEVMNAFVEAHKNLDLETMLPYLSGTAREVVKSTFDAFSGELAEELVDFMPVGTVQMMEDFMNDPMVQEGLQEGLRSIYSQLTVVSSEYVGDEFHFKLRIPIPKIEMPDVSEMPELQGIELPEGMELPEMPDQMEMPDMTHKMRKEDGAWQIYDIDY